MSVLTKRKAFLLRVGDDSAPAVYRTVAGMRVNREVISADQVEIDAAGVFLGSAAESEVRHFALSGDSFPAQLSFEDGNRIEGLFAVERMQFAGDFNGERNYSVRLVRGVVPLARIRNAAPDMLKALEGLADVVENDCDCPPCIGSMAPGEHYLGLARAAIAKAKGESSKELSDSQGGPLT